MILSTGGVPGPMGGSGPREGLVWAGACSQVGHLVENPRDGYCCGRLFFLIFFPTHCANPLVRDLKIKSLYLVRMALFTLLWRSSSWACWGQGKRNCPRACCWILLGETPCPECPPCGLRELTPNRRAACTERRRNTCYSVINQCKKQRSIHTKRKQERKQKRSKIKRQISQKIFAFEFAFA